MSEKASPIHFRFKKTINNESRSFSVVAPTLWDSLPDNVKSAIAVQY